MNVFDIQRGEITTIEIRTSDGDAFETRIPVHSEVTLQFNDTVNEVFLKFKEDNIWTIKGANKKNQAVLSKITERNLPKICWIAAADPKKEKPERLVLQIHEFPALHVWEEAMDIGVDEKIVEDIRKKHSRLTSVDKAVEWLSEKMIIRTEGENMPQRVLLSGSPTPQADLKTAFRLWGKGFAVDIVKGEQDRFVVNKLVTSKKISGSHDQRPVMLIRGNIRFCDATIAGQFRGAARSELDRIVARSGSYLGIWKEYNRLERNNILHRARTFGWLQYREYKPLSDGCYRFYLAESPEKLEKADHHLRENEAITLEISSHPPIFLQKKMENNEETDDGFDGGFHRKKQVFMGECIGINLKNKTLDIRPPYDRELEKPVKTGVIYIGQIGDRIRLERREKAHALIASAGTPMPQLGLLIENKPVRQRRGKRYEALSPEAKKRLGGRPTVYQEKAIERALNTSNIALIQGPPGTGKTAVIAALQARIAEISEENKNISGRYLLTSYQHDAVENVARRTRVFGLPAVKIGKRSDQAEEKDGFDSWRKEHIESVRADLAQLPVHPLSDKLKKIRTLAASYMITPLRNEDVGGLLKNISDIGGDELPDDLKDRLLALRQTLKRAVMLLDDPDDERDMLLKAVRAVRTEAEAFCDDGPRNARKLLIRLRNKDILSPDEKRVLQSASEWETDEAPDFLEKLAEAKLALIDRLTPDERPADAPVVNADVEALLTDIVDALYQKVRKSKAGPEAVLYDYLDDLENDPEGVKEAIRNYTLVLAATCQQAVGGKMTAHTGREETVFDTVVVDEAARANPLDLFIPMSRAERRIILVGDHRQLPHILEADIEKQLEASSEIKTHENIKRSLFFKLFEAIKKRDAEDGIEPRRTITLDEQFRMHPVLGDFVSKTFYEPYREGFKSAEQTAELVHDLDGYNHAVAAWKNIPAKKGRESGKYSKRRKAEAEWIVEEVKRLMVLNPDFSFGIITFYAAQVQVLYEALLKRGIAEAPEGENYAISQRWRSRLRVGTVDAFQGKEFDVVFLSMVRSNDIPANDGKGIRRKYGHLIHENRLCVALSRQKRLLIVTGDEKMLQGEIARKAIPGLIAFKKLCEGDHGICF